MAYYLLATYLLASRNIQTT